MEGYNSKVFLKSGLKELDELICLVVASHCVPEDETTNYT
jgi:hypothetical protein